MPPPPAIVAGGAYLPHEAVEEMFRGESSPRVTGQDPRLGMAVKGGGSVDDTIRHVYFPSAITHPWLHGDVTVRRCKSFHSYPIKSGQMSV